MQNVQVKFKKLDERAVTPAYATAGSAAADLCAVLDATLTLGPGERALVPTGLAIQLPGPQWVALVFARSGLAVKKGVCLSNSVGVIDSDYRGEVKVGLVNLSKSPCEIAPGERIAQMMIAPVTVAAFVPAEQLEETDRGAGGFGSTGRASLEETRK